MTLMPPDEMLPAPLAAAVERWRALPERDTCAERSRESLLARIAGLPRPRARKRGRATYLLTAAAVVLAAGITLWRPAGDRTPAVLTPEVASASSPVTFVLDAGDARAVYLTGDFTGWSGSGIALVREGNRWSATVRLPAGRYSYAFRVDDRWVADALAPQSPADFGPPSSVVIVSNWSNP